MKNYRYVFKSGELVLIGKRFMTHKREQFQKCCDLNFITVIILTRFAKKWDITFMARGNNWSTG